MVLKPRRGSQTLLPFRGGRKELTKNLASALQLTAEMRAGSEGRVRIFLLFSQGTEACCVLSEEQKQAVSVSTCRKKCNSQLRLKLSI